VISFANHDRSDLTGLVTLFKERDGLWLGSVNKE
jgi:hypothetical protein